MNWYRFRTVKSKLHHRATSRAERAAKRKLRRQTSQLEPCVGLERGRRVGSVSTSTEDAVAVERTVRKAVLTPRRDQDGRVRRHGSSTGRGPRFFSHRVMLGHQDMSLTRSERALRCAVRGDIGDCGISRACETPQCRFCLRGRTIATREALRARSDVPGGSKLLSSTVLVYINVLPTLDTSDRPTNDRPGTHRGPWTHTRRATGQHQSGPARASPAAPLHGSGTTAQPRVWRSRRAAAGPMTPSNKRTPAPEVFKCKAKAHHATRQRHHRTQKRRTSSKMMILHAQGRTWNPLASSGRSRAP